MSPKVYPGCCQMQYDYIRNSHSIKIKGGTHMKRIFAAAIMAGLLTVSMTALPAAADAVPTSDINVEAPSEEIGGSIYVELMSNGAKAYVYVPDNELYGFRATAAPILIVFGNEAYTSQTAMQTALDSGLAALADLEQTAIVFVNPIGETWAEDDATSLEAAKKMFSDGTNNAVRASSFTVNGKNEDAAFAGSYLRLYVFAEGAGADFVYSQLSKGVAGGGQFFGNANFKPISAFLMNPASTEEIDLAAEDAREVPVVIVNGTEAVINAYKALNTTVPTETVESEVTEGFDAEALLKAYDDVLEHYLVRVQSSLGLEFCETTLLPLPGNAELGLTEEKKEYTFEDGTALSYYEWTCGKENAPLFALFHGSASCAENIAWTSGLVSLAASEGFNLASFENYSNEDIDNDKIMEAIAAAIEETGSDASRLYVGGFSMGSIRTWALASGYSDKIAGAIGMNGFNSGMAEDGFKSSVPFFCYGGKESYLAGFFEFPSADNYAQEAAIFAANGVTDSFEFDPEYTWGLEAANVTGEVSEVLPDLEVEFSEFPSADGEVLTMFASASSAGHEPIPEAVEGGWKFVSQYSRLEDGTLVKAE